MNLEAWDEVVGEVGANAEWRSTIEPMSNVITISKDQAIGCCASPAWAEKIAACSPFRDFSDLIDAARSIWWAKIGPSEWLSAFAAHPKIGDNKAVEQKPAAFAAFSRSEQAAANETSSTDVAQELLRWNRCHPHVTMLCTLTMWGPHEMDLCGFLLSAISSSAIPSFRPQALPGEIRLHFHHLRKGEVVP